MAERHLRIALLLTCLGTALVIAGAPVRAAQAIATFKVGIRIVPVAMTAGEAAAVTSPQRQATRDEAVGMRTVVVQPGDTLSAIAARIYGDSGRYADIFAANRDILSAPDRLPAGVRLRIP